MDAYRAVIFPAIFLIVLQIILLSVALDSETLEGFVDVIFADDWTSPDDEKYDTFFGNNPIAWFADNMYLVLLKIGALFGLFLMFVTPITSIAVIWISVSAGVAVILTIILGFLYLILAIGLYKVISPFTGK